MSTKNSISNNVYNWLINMHNFDIEPELWNDLTEDEKEQFQKVREENLYHYTKYQESKINNELYKNILNALPFPCALKNAKGEFLFINPAHVKTFNLSTNEPYQTIDDFHILSDKERLGLQIDNAIALDSLCTIQKPFSYEADPLNRRFYYWVCGFQCKNNNRYTFSVTQDVTEFVQTENKLSEQVAMLESTNENIIRLSNLDPLTGAYNRTSLVEFFELNFREARRTKSTFSILLLDIDHFKNVNDKFGHLVGDKLLQDMVTLLKNSVREKDMVFRFGGEEFLLLLPKTNFIQAYEVAERIRIHISKNLKRPDNSMITISIGIANYTNEKTATDLIKIADENLYRAKNNGRNCVIPQVNTQNKGIF